MHQSKKIQWRYFGHFQLTESGKKNPQNNEIGLSVFIHVNVSKVKWSKMINFHTIRKPKENTVSSGKTKSFSL